MSHFKTKVHQIRFLAYVRLSLCLFICLSVCVLGPRWSLTLSPRSSRLVLLPQMQRQRQRHITLVERLKSHTATSEALVMSQAKLA